VSIISLSVPKTCSLYSFNFLTHSMNYLSTVISAQVHVIPFLSLCIRQVPGFILIRSISQTGFWVIFYSLYSRIGSGCPIISLYHISSPTGSSRLSNRFLLLYFGQVPGVTFSISHRFQVSYLLFLFPDRFLVS
jgi:hypothetical protein